MESHLGMYLAASQSEAVRLALTAKLLVITGGPGVGKTTIVWARILLVTGCGVGIAAGAVWFLVYLACGRSMNT